MDVAVDVDRRLPGCPAVRRPGNTADVDVREKYRAVRAGGHRPDPERRSDTLTVDDCRACVPCLAPGDDVEAAEWLEVSICADAQNAGIVGPGVDDVADRDAAREIPLRRCDRAPHAAGRAPAKRASVDDGERTAMPVGCERSDRLIAELVAGSLAADNEQTVAPGSDKHRWSRQDGLLATRFDFIALPC
jgi:hypothetical protein